MQCVQVLLTKSDVCVAESREKGEWKCRRRNISVHVGCFAVLLPGVQTQFTLITEWIYERTELQSSNLKRPWQYVPCHGYSSQPSTKYHFSHRTLFHFIGPHHPATWAGSRAGSPVFVSLWRRPERLEATYCSTGGIYYTEESCFVLCFSTL